MFRIQNIIKNICNTNNDVIKLTPSQLSKLQNHLLGMYKDLEKVCSNHNLRISLAYGNVLGAIRHNGWIPWDDDLDIVMPREDYNLLMSKYISELPSKYKIYSLDSADGPITRFPKLIDTTTKFESFLDLGPKHHEGVFIDIFVLDNTPKFQIIHKIKKIIALGLMFISNSVNQVENLTDDYKNLLCSDPKGANAFKLRQIVGKTFCFIPLKKWYALLDKLIQNNNNTNGDFYCGIGTGPEWKPLPKTYIFPVRKFVFNNGISVNIPGRAEDFLTYQYGDWHKIPQNKDIWQHYVKGFYIPN